MKKWIMIIVILAVVGVIAAFLVNKFYINKPHADIEHATPAYTMTANELWKQFNSNLKLADSLYTGKVIEVTGNMNKLEKADTVEYAVFVMEQDSMFGDKSIRCELLQNYFEEASKIAIGSSVKVKGFCNGFDQTDVKFSKCSFVK
ncbi:MAG: hypothetical protein HXX13_06150 [Bacteroidetes bacterium]|nr:hypothetical protein [Bacteroidota bacterium]